jgi:hypothetical protein
MGDLGGDFSGKSAKKYFGYSIQTMYLILTLFVVVLLILFTGVFGLFDFVKNKISNSENDVCGDGTIYDNCSVVRPYFCLEGKLIDYASVCGCPEGFAKINDSCISFYQINPKEISLNYVLRGESYLLNFTVYSGFENYVSEISRSIRYSGGDKYSRADFKLKAINEEEQRKFLLPLIISIENITSNKDDQVRIAISIVQNIPFGASAKTTTFGSYVVNYSRYPYDVLYDMQGICGEKTDLLAFLLKGIGYGTSFFYYPLYNHEALGIKCPMKESLTGSGYCFIETTGPSILTDNKISYVRIGKIYENPEIYPLSDGNSLSKNLYEYSDSEKLIRIRGIIERGGWLNPLMKRAYERLKEKYGLVDSYNG